MRCNLVGGLEHGFYLSIQLGILSSQLTFIFFRWVETTDQQYNYHTPQIVVFTYFIQTINPGGLSLSIDV
jgi:hypothetical protein